MGYTVICHGIKYDSVAEFTEYLKGDMNRILLRLKNKETPEQIYEKYVCDIEVDGIIFNRAYDLAKYMGMDMKVITKKRDRGVSWENIILEEKELRRTVELTGLERKSVFACLNKGITHESLIKTHCINYKYKGVIYKNLKSLSDEFNIPLNTLTWAMDKGNLNETIYLSSPIEYEGKVYKNHKELVEIKGKVSYANYINKLREKYSAEEALRDTRAVVVSKKEVMELTKLSRSVVNQLLRKGETYESILKKYCIDFTVNGKKYTSLKLLSEELSIPLQILTRWLKDGIDLKEIVYLYTPIEYKGKIYENHRELVNDKGSVGYYVYVNKIRRGYSIENSLSDMSDFSYKKVFNVTIKRIAEVYFRSFAGIIKYLDNIENYVTEILLWENINFLGLTEDNLIVYRKKEDSKIVYTSFEEYINYLEITERII